MFDTVKLRELPIGAFGGSPAWFAAAAPLNRLKVGGLPKARAAIVALAS